MASIATTTRSRRKPTSDRISSSGIDRLFKLSLRGAKRRSNPTVVSKRWIASRSPSLGAHSRGPLARDDGSLCLALSGDDLINLRQQLPPPLVNLRRPVGPENFTQLIRDHAEKFAEQLSGGAVGVVRLHLALDHAKVPRAVAGEIQDGIDGQRHH